MITFEHTPIQPNTVFCIGRNYAEHARELGNAIPSEPMIFLKPNACLIGAGQDIVLPSYSQDVNFESELVLLVGQDVDDLTPDRAWQVVQGVAVGLDLTARDIQAQVKRQGYPWTKAKGFRTAGCLSNFVASDKLPSLQDIAFTLHINGQLRQHGHTHDMIVAIPQLLCYLVAIYGLRKGDLVFTGTPAGVGKLNVDDELVLNLANGLAVAEFVVTGSTQMA